MKIILFTYIAIPSYDLQTLSFWLSVFAYLTLKKYSGIGSSDVNNLEMETRVISLWKSWR